eukprot:1168487-Amphidinium_carterae.1
MAFLFAACLGSEPVPTMNLLMRYYQLSAKHTADFRGVHSVPLELRSRSSRQLFVARSDPLPILAVSTLGCRTTLAWRTRHLLLVFAWVQFLQSHPRRWCNGSASCCTCNKLYLVNIVDIDSLTDIYRRQRVFPRRLHQP